jgi:large subunit ribosomal protein L15
MSVLHTLLSIVDKSKKRVGRGQGSGKARTAGRGQKGYKSRTGSKVPLWFEGGQLPLVKRLPMLRGKSRFNVLTPSAELTLSDLQRMAKSVDVISLESLKLAGLIDRHFKKVKIIATGTITTAVTVQGIPATEAATKAIVKAGGTLK